MSGETVEEQVDRCGQDTQRQDALQQHARQFLLQRITAFIGTRRHQHHGYDEPYHQEVDATGAQQHAVRTVGDGIHAQQPLVDADVDRQVHQHDGNPVKQELFGIECLEIHSEQRLSGWRRADASRIILRTKVMLPAV